MVSPNLGPLPKQGSYKIVDKIVVPIICILVYIYIVIYIGVFPHLWKEPLESILVRTSRFHASGHAYTPQTNMEPEKAPFVVYSPGEHPNPQKDLKIRSPRNIGRNYIRII